MQIIPIEGAEILRKKLAICLKALRKIAKETEWVDGDSTYNQRYKSPTSASYVAKNALEEISN